MKARLRAVDPEQLHPLDIAAQRVKEFRLDRDKQEKPLPIATAHDVHGAPLLDVKTTEVNARPNHAPNVAETRRRPLLKRLLRRR